LTAKKEQGNRELQLFNLVETHGQVLPKGNEEFFSLSPDRTRDRGAGHSRLCSERRYEGMIGE
jgi:hypothetical protein